MRFINKGNVQSTGEDQLIRRHLSVTQVNHFVKSVISTNSLLKNVDIEGEVCVMKYNEFSEVKIQPSITFIDKRFIELIDKIKMYKDVL